MLLPDGTNVNHELVKDGWCWWYRKYAPFNTGFEQQQNAARSILNGVETRVTNLLQH
jgi:endonuclease YncB( thermonuclease family)